MAKDKLEVKKKALEKNIKNLCLRFKRDTGYDVGRLEVALKDGQHSVDIALRGGHFAEHHGRFDSDGR